MDKIKHDTALAAEPAYTPTGVQGYATDGDPGLGVPATIYPAAYFNMLQDEIYNVLVSGGVTPDFTVRTQLRDAIKAMALGGSFGTTTNVGNAYSVSTTPTFTTVEDGRLMSVIFNATNTGAVTLDVNAIGAVDVVKSGGGVLNAGDIVANTLYVISYDGADFRLSTVDAVLADGVNVFTVSNFFNSLFGFPDGGELTISGGAITPTKVAHTVDTEGDSPTDDLVTISGGAGGQLLILRTAADARDVTLTEAGNIVLPGSTSITMSDTKDIVTLMYDLELTKWVVVSSPAPVAPTPIFSAEYESAEQTLTTAGSLSLTHGLGAKPKVTQLTLICKTAEGGYSVGDEVAVTENNINSTATRAPSVVTNDTSDTKILIRYPSAAPLWQLTRKDNGAFLDITSANWKLIVRAYA